MPITTITFDWGDTLATNHGQPYGFQHRRALRTLAEALGSVAGAAVPVDWFDTCHAELQEDWMRSVDPQRNPDHREFDMAALIDGWARRAGCDPAAPAVRTALDAMADSCIDLVLAYEGVEPVLAALQARGFRLGILSHVPWPEDCCRRWYQRRGWDRYFSFYSFSSGVGWIKPSVHHYEHARAAAGCPASDILHVGDHPERDVAGARQFGFRTCLRVTGGVYPSDMLDVCAPDFRVAHVAELLELQELQRLP